MQALGGSTARSSSTRQQRASGQWLSSSASVRVQKWRREFKPCVQSELGTRAGRRSLLVGGKTARKDRQKHTGQADASALAAFVRMAESQSPYHHNNVDERKLRDQAVVSKAVRYCFYRMCEIP